MIADEERARERMVKEQLIPRGIRDARVLDAMRKIPRHRFVPKGMEAAAYEDRPLQIGHDQTISQPYMVALMTEALELTGGEKTLEIGTGSGYQAALLAELSLWLYTVERIEELQERARGILEALGYTNISYHISNGTLGWEEHAPYDAIMVTAAGPSLPESLKRQLADGGRLVAPVGGYGHQVLVRVTRRGEKFKEERGIDCVFVRLIGAEGHEG